MSHNDWIPTLASIAGEPDIVNKLKSGYTANGINYKVHLDGYDQSAFLRNVSGTAGNNNGTKSARDKFFYADDDGLLVAFRKGDYKYVYAEQRLAGTMGVWAEPFTKLRLQKTFNLMQDPFERADITSNTFWDWQLNHVGSVYGAMDEVFQFVDDLQGVSAALVPPELRAGDHHGRHDQQYERKGRDQAGPCAENRAPGLSDNKCHSAAGRWAHGPLDDR